MLNITQEDKCLICGNANLGDNYFQRIIGMVEIKEPAREVIFRVKEKLCLECGRKAKNKVLAHYQPLEKLGVGVND